ncbi:hypothetical protein [Paraburkholderia sp. J12]|uniref:hypothetical protein n=1 Tax=Paraburkholderia sp. J12 TaxID=2805432 RepID=UPI002ABDEAA2|nr:hypothetical protein [Paraburkholderia sp. J12]
MDWDSKKERLKGQVMLTAYALLGNEILAWVLSCLVMVLYPGTQRWWFVAFGALTMPATMRWLRFDAKKAYETAASRQFLGFDGIPPRVISIANDCPGRWLVLLHIQMHPELRWRER